MTKKREKERRRMNRGGQRKIVCIREERWREREETGRKGMRPAGNGLREEMRKGAVRRTGET